MYSFGLNSWTQTLIDSSGAPIDSCTAAVTAVRRAFFCSSVRPSSKWISMSGIGTPFASHSSKDGPLPEGLTLGGPFDRTCSLEKALMVIKTSEQGNIAVFDIEGEIRRSDTV